MAMKPADLFARMNTRQFRRGATLTAFYIVLGLLLVTLLGSFINPVESQLSAYDDDWDDIFQF